ncbi:uncharacterized protein [Dermacentor albipictus]|uniref:uncharacterized protein isoform X2 n=1 Tax=Dermacentor albipictus TaxID=60249 RepID=UPI0038FC8AA4
MHATLICLVTLTVIAQVLPQASSLPLRNCHLFSVVCAMIERRWQVYEQHRTGPMENGESGRARRISSANVPIFICRQWAVVDVVLTTMSLTRKVTGSIMKSQKISLRNIPSLKAASETQVPEEQLLHLPNRCSVPKGIKDGYHRSLQRWRLPPAGEQWV